MKNYQIIHYLWELTKTFLPAIITGFITFAAMWFIDKQNKERWLNDSFVKYQNDLIINLNKNLLNFYNKFEKYFNLEDGIPSQKPHINGFFVLEFFVNNGQEFKELKNLYAELSDSYGFEIGYLNSVMSRFDYILKYVQKGTNLKTNTIIPLNNTTEVPYGYYLGVLASEFRQARQVTSSNIQRKLRAGIL